MNTHNSYPCPFNSLRLANLIIMLCLFTSIQSFAQECGPVRSEKTGRVLEIGECNGLGQRHGEWTFYYDNNLKNEIRLKAKGTYHLGKKSGTWTYYDTYGPYVLKEATYVFDRLNGPYKDYYDTGHKDRWIKSKGEYKEGKREGQWTDFWDNGCYRLEGPPKEIAIYKAGIKHGESMTFYDSNCFPEKAMASRGYYDNGKKDGEWKYFDDKGNEDANLIKKLNFDKGRMVGRHYFYENGRISKSFDYTAEPGDEGLPEFNEEGKLIKKVYPNYYLTFHENDSNTPSVKEKIEINAQGEKTGTWLTYYESGGIQYEDTPEGRIAYHENGRLFYTVSHSKNDRTLWDGVQRVYRKDGSLEQLKLYVESLSWGKHIQELKYAVHFYPNGKIHQVNKHWNPGNIIAEQHELYEDGSLKAIGGERKKKKRKYKQGRKFPSDPPEWQVRAYQLSGASSLLPRIKSFFELVNETAK